MGGGIVHDIAAGMFNNVGLVDTSGNLTVDTTLTADFTAGLTTATVPAAFLVPSASPTEGLNVGVHAYV